MKDQASRLRLQAIADRTHHSGIECQREYKPGHWQICGPRLGSYREGFRWLWDSINKKKAPWLLNPWVWVIEFRELLQVVSKSEFSRGEAVSR